MGSAATEANSASELAAKAASPTTHADERANDDSNIDDSNIGTDADLQAELQYAALTACSTVGAVLRLARAELSLSSALALRALLLAAIALVCVVLAIALASALLVALALSAGLGWPGSLALSLLLAFLGALCCLLWARRCLSGCGLTRTRAILATLLPEPRP